MKPHSRLFCRIDMEFKQLVTSATFLISAVLVMVDIGFDFALFRKYFIQYVAFVTICNKTTPSPHDDFNDLTLYWTNFKTCRDNHGNYPRMFSKQ